jgi:hypothetical protein
MAHFYGIVSGRARTAASRCGTRQSGLDVVVGGHGVAVSVRCYVDGKGRDVVLVRSQNGTRGTLCGRTMTVIEGKEKFDG